MKVIFLDFDGVITTYGSGWRISDEKMLLVKGICDRTDAKIVISSSWRWTDVPTTLKSIFGEDYDDSHYLLNSRTVVGITGRRKDDFRGKEIQDYLDSHKDIENYVILDDDNDILKRQRPHFVKTSSYFGIFREDAERAIEILNSK